MKLTLLLIPLLFFMTSCSIDWNDEKDKRILELEKQVQEDVFKKKIQCSDLRKKEEEKYKEYERNSNNILYTVKEVFYSKSKESCILWLETSTYLETKTAERYKLEDILSGESLGTTPTGCLEYMENENLLNICTKQVADFDKKVQELKGEQFHSNP